MADIPATVGTGATIAVGGSVSDSLETGGDHDWFAIQLTFGQQVSVALNGITLADPYLTIRNAAGTILYQNDDSGPGLNALYAFAAPSTGTYFIDVGAATTTDTGTYNLSVTPYSLPPLGTIDQMADWMTSGFWNGERHHFNVTQGSTITVNFTGLTAEGIGLARTALDLWTDVIGVTFTEVTTGGQIVFDDLEQGTGAFSDGVWSNGITTSATVNVAPSRFGTGTGIARSGLQTYIHEIGHALGLGHNGDYNGGTAFSRYPYEAMFLNDGAAVSIMSYFDNGENSYYANQGFSNVLVATPQIADIAAAGLLYGLSTTTRTGDTTYGFNNNSGREVFDAALHPFFSYAIIDSGGVDTLDYSGFGTNQRLDLNPETFSSVGGLIGNVSIARGTVIENAIGGSGADMLIGNGADNILKGNAGADTLTGGAGNDTFRDTAASLSGDTITDFEAGDRIVITDANLAGFAFSLTGNTLTFSGGSLTLASTVQGHLAASAAAGGGVALTLMRHVANDFDGDGRSDILWRNDNGALTDWLGTSSGGFAPNAANLLTVVDNQWQATGTGDFNGDGRSDVLWRRADGAMTDWLGAQGGGLSPNGANLLLVVDPQWQVAGVGDFNGDGRDDILWHRADGALTNWLGNQNGAFLPNAAVMLDVVSPDWRIAGVGDFNGDGRDDILWRNVDGRITDWLGTGSGAFTDNVGNAYNAVANDWQVAGIGDFNGDHRDDILWRNVDGRITDWLGNASGGFTPNSANFYTSVGADWTVASIGDFNGDTRDDILFRNADGRMTDWLGTSTGSFSDNLPNAYQVVDTHWHVEPHTNLV